MAGSLVLGMTACGGSGSDGVKVGLITKTDSNPYFVHLREAAQAQADKDGAQLIASPGRSTATTKARSRPSRTWSVRASRAS